MPLGAPARILPTEKSPEPRLVLVDHIGIGEDIVSEAQKQQGERLKAVEATFQEPAPVRTPRRRTTRQKPAEAPVEVTHINAVAKGVALLIAGNDWTRCQPVSATEIVVHNHPIRKKKTRAGRSGSTR